MCWSLKAKSFWWLKENAIKSVVYCSEINLKPNSHSSLSLTFLLLLPLQFILRLHLWLSHKSELNLHLTNTWLQLLQNNFWFIKIVEKFCDEIVVKLLANNSNDSLIGNKFTLRMESRIIETIDNCIETN